MGGQQITVRQENAGSSNRNSSINPAQFERPQELVFPLDQRDLVPKLCEPIRDLTQTLLDSVLGIAIAKHYQTHRNLLDKNFQAHLADVILNIEMRTNHEML